jgi:hypothetical protein
MATSKRPPNKIDYVFDELEHVVKRTERLLGKTKSLLFGLALLLLLIYELILVGKTLFNGH